jgi:transcriptional regulator with GAF, ATPase, and Fis domain
VAPAEQVAEAIFAASGGHAGTVELLAREAFASPHQPRWLWAPAVARESIGAPGLPAALMERFEIGWQALSPEERRLLGVSALLPEDRGALAPDDPVWASTFAGLAVLASCVRRGWLRRAAHGVLVFASPLARQAVLARLGDPALREIVTAATRWLGATDPRQAELRLALGDPQGATALLLDVARAAQRDGDAGRAAAAWSRAFAIAPEALLPGDRLGLAEILEVYARYDDALALLAAPLDELNPEVRAPLIEREAAILARQGSLGAARRRLEAAMAETVAGAPSAALFTSRLARIALAEGDARVALVHAESSLGEPGRAGLVALEVAVMALAQLGRSSEAAALLARHAPNPASASASIVGRHAHLRGYLAQVGGRVAEGREHYRLAVESYEHGGERHALASARFNLGCLLADEGRFAEALTTLDLAGRELGRLGAEVDRALARFDIGVLQVRLGGLEEAQGIVTALRRPLAMGAADHLSAALASYLEGDIRRRDGRAAAAAALYGDAEVALAHAGQGWLAATAAFARVEALVEAGQVTQAERLIAQRSEGADAAQAGPVREARLQALARLGLAQPAAAPSALVGLGEQLQAEARLADDQGRRPAALRAALLAARLFRSAGDVIHAPGALNLVRALVEALKASTPARYRGAFEADPDVRALGASSKGDGEDSHGAIVRRAERAEGRLRRLARINKRLNSELRLQRVLEIIVDTVIELTDAERGFLLLRDDGGELSIRVARNIDAETLAGPPLELSRSIARQVAASGSPVVTLDAVDDDRFKAAVSVSDLRLRSILAAPLAVKGRVVGVIYVDHRLRRGAFDEEDVSLVVDFAEQGALAIENARVLGELRRRERQIEALNRRLRVELDRRGAELADMRQEMVETRAAERFRYDYSRLVGKTPRMVSVFRLLDRVTATDLPVVILGESGTGKELVARALHFNGPRRERPFVSENCAAIPETLLESALFGAVRGAYTGAERETRGLFSVANGGTLFLDEVAEMSPALQGKLLRVLQDGEFRRLGGERTERVDVRVIAATNKDLERMVEEKRFRQDLFFRLCVVRVDLPPLRERREDIPLLVSHFLRTQAESTRSPAKGIEPAALARLGAYRWPGNVRELENELLRASAFAGATITPADLSPRIAAGPDAVIVEDDSANLALRPRIERLERALIREALSRTGGNQTKAAEALGLSRFGLQKKLQRYRMRP